MENEMENLVGPRSDERLEETPEETAADGTPLWMAFLKDPEALVVEPNEVQDAKNALVRARVEHPEIISMCKHKTIQECAQTLHFSGDHSLAA